MKYKQALSIGKSEGTIQCTYAMIYDANGNGVFALQRKHFEEFGEIENLAKGNGGADTYKQSTENLIVTYTGDGAEGIISWDTGKGYRENRDTATGYITFDMPLVVASEWSGETLVPVRLLFPAIAYIKKTLASAKEIVINIYYKFASKEDRDAAEQMLNAGDMSFESMAIDKTEHKRTGQKWYQSEKDTVLVAYRRGYASIWENLINNLSEDTIYYVKPAAFNWQPVDLSNCTDGKGVPCNEKVRIAKEKLDKARALLIASGTTIFA